MHAFTERQVLKHFIFAAFKTFLALSSFGIALDLLTTAIIDGGFTYKAQGFYVATSFFAGTYIQWTAIRDWEAARRLFW